MFFGGAFLAVSFVVIMVNQTYQLVQLARAVHPVFGSAVLWALVAVYGVMAAVPFVIALRLPASLKTPASDDGPEFQHYIAGVSQRLRKNSNLSHRAINTIDDVRAAIAELDANANELVRRTASSVFVTTALSQNGNLDGVLVLAAQFRMVWQIAHLYWQRPTIRELGTLYMNVAGTAFVAVGMEDADLEEQIAPLLTAAVGSTVGAIPGFQAAASVLAASLLTGSANAYLTLRVGVITRRYCSSLVTLDRRAVRRAAAVEAAGMLVAVAGGNAAKITKAVFAKFKGTIATTARSVTDSAAAAATAADSAGVDVATAVGQAIGRALSRLLPKADPAKS